MNQDLTNRFRGSLLETLRDERFSEWLRTSAAAARLMPWTKALTAATVGACRRLDWRASAKGHHAELLPVSRGEYLNLDVMAFGPGEARWRFPLAVMEMENQQRGDFIAYSLWKVLSVRAALRVVFCYRKEASKIAALTGALSRDVIASMGLHERAELEGQTMVVVGSRGDAATFPHGYFHWWELNLSTGKFERI